MAKPRFNLIFVFLPLLAVLLPLAAAQLKQNFYASVCPNVETIVRNVVTKKLQQTFFTAPGTLRLFFHDCMVRGCDASVLLASANGNNEKDNSNNLSLGGDAFDTVAKAKEALDAVPQCRNQVSCADILALATRDVVSLAGGPSWPVELGRRDGRISTKASVGNSLPQPTFNLTQLNNLFALHGLSQTDMIALSGAHTIGSSHCNKFTNRIYSFSKTSAIDPTMNTEYALQLRKECPANVDPRMARPIDVATPLVFDNVYYQNLQKGLGLLASDQVLFTDPRSRATVNLFASDKNAFYKAFAEAMTKLGRVGVKTGNQGEIRRNCFLIN